MGCTPIKKIRPINTRIQKVKVSDENVPMIQDFYGVCRHYNFVKKLGDGKYGTVFLAKSLMTGQKVAVKAIERANWILDDLMNEIEVLASLDHPNIVKYLKHYLSDKYLYIITEYCEGKELFRKIEDYNTLSESETLSIMKKLLRAVSHWHHQGIIHCDLKAENVMCSENSVKVIDFGLSMKAGSLTDEGLAGTMHYIAPEVAKNRIYTKAYDIWSLGVIMHAMLAGCVPVGGTDLENTLANLKEYTGVKLDSRAWTKVSSEAKDLLAKMLTADHERRITAEEALRHPWFKSESSSDAATNTTVLEAFKRYGEYPSIKKTILKEMVKNLGDEDLKEYQNAFLELDEGKGIISPANLKARLRNCEMNIREMENIMKKASKNGKAFITYTEFVASQIATSSFLTEERLSLLFKTLEPNIETSIKRKL